MTLDGDTLRSTDLAGKVVVVNFWATWCVPCRLEVPSLQKLHERHLGEDLVVLGLSVDVGGEAAIREYLRERGVTYPVARATDAQRRAFGAEERVPDLPKAMDINELHIPDDLDFSSYDFTLAGEPHRWGDYDIGEQIDHIDGVTIEEAEHMMATRLWQNTAKVHFDTSARPDGSRLIYGGHVISMARALSFNGLANAQMIVGLNGGAHANPCLSGDTIRAWSEVLDKADTSAPGVGAIRLRLVATKGGAPFKLKGEDGKYLPDVLLDLDYWALMPK